MTNKLPGVAVYANVGDTQTATSKDWQSKREPSAALLADLVAEIPAATVSKDWRAELQEMARVTPVTVLADALLALDGLQQCDLAAALVRRDARQADALSTTIGDAVAGLSAPWCEQCNLPADICRGHDNAAVAAKLRAVAEGDTDSIGAIAEAAQIVLALSADELDEFAWMIADANKERADLLAESLMDTVDALGAANVTTAPADDPAVTAALRALMALDATQMAALAQKLADVDATFSDKLADMLLGNVGLDLPPVMPSERFLRAVLANVASEDYRHQVAMAQ